MSVTQSSPPQTLPSEKPVGSRFPQNPTNIGLELLGQRNYAEALSHYMELARSCPSDATAWMGAATALTGLQRLDDAASFLLKARQLDADMPLGPLIELGNPTPPDLYRLARACTRLQKTAVAYRCSLELLERLMITPHVAESLYRRAARRERKVRQATERSDPKLKLQRRIIAQRRIVRALWALIAVAGVVSLGYFGHRVVAHVRAAAYYDVGLSDYLEARHIETKGLGKLASSRDISDPLVMYRRSYASFRRATELDPAFFDANFLLVKAGQDIFRRQPEPAVRASVNQATSRLSAMDPSGTRKAEMEAAYQQRLRNYIGENVE